MLALAARGRTGRRTVAAVATGSFAVGLAVTAVFAARFAPAALGAESTERFLSEKTSYYDGVRFLNDRLAPDDRVLLGFSSALYLDVPYAIWTADLIPPAATGAEVRAKARELGVTHAAVLASDARRLRQLAYLDARPVGSVRVHPIVSRALDEQGPADTLVLYELR
jgi:hypothetical protein